MDYGLENGVVSIVNSGIWTAILWLLRRTLLFFRNRHWSIKSKGSISSPCSQVIQKRKRSLNVRVCVKGRGGMEGRSKDGKQTGEMRTKSNVGYRPQVSPVLFSEPLHKREIIPKSYRKKNTEIHTKLCHLQLLAFKILASKCCVKGIFKALMHFTKISQVLGNKTASLNTKPPGPEPSISLWANWVWRQCVGWDTTVGSALLTLKALRKAEAWEAALSSSNSGSLLHR